MTATDDAIEHAISLFDRAAEANLSLPTRRGHVVDLPPTPGGEIMITADLHGDRLNFERILEIADLDQHPLRHLVLQEVCHGGPSYPGGLGCMSHLLLEDAAAFRNRYPDRVHFILSNHELAEATDFPISKSGELQNVTFRMGLQQLYGESTDRVHNALRAFLMSCPVALRFGGNVLVSHTVPPRCDQREPRFDFLDREWQFEDYEPGGDLFRFVWGRDFRRENAEIVAQALGVNLMIHGHEPCPLGFQTPNEIQIIIDSFGPHGRYILAPLDRQLTQPDLLHCIGRINP